MASTGGEGAIREVGGLLERGPSGALADSELLERYLSGRDEAAFGVLVQRHGPMVLRVCRAVLGDANEAQDAFQATFFVLARHARAIRRRDSAASWLHGVARRVALRARRDLARRRRHERRAAERTPEAAQPEAGREDLHALDEEVARLPGAIREAVVLCHLEGMTYDAAAARLGVTEATVRGRLARGRDRLRSRLARRGLAAPSLAPEVTSPAAAPAVPAGLSHSTERIARGLLAGKAKLAALPAGVAALSEGVFQAMMLEKIRWTAVLLAVGCSATGALVHAQRAAQPQPQPKAAPAPKRPAPDPPAQPSKLSHGDGQPDGKRSLGGSGEMIEFALPADGRKVAGLRIHGSRYGTPNPPDESFLIYFLDENLGEVVAARLAPYALFERGEGRWVDVTFARPVEATGRTWVALDFRATGTKGVYLSYDASTGGRHSRVGLPGIQSKPVDFGDWMVEVLLAK